MPDPSFKPELIGERFARHEVPLEVLKDFAAFEEMLIEVAKREYLADHPDRLRIPRGFTTGVELRLAAIEPGSAILSLILAGLSIGDASVYVTRAHDKIVNSIANVEHGQQPELPPELLRYFDRFGRSLLEGESINFQRTGGGRASLTPEVREKLLRASQAEEWTEETLLKGRVSAADVADEEFELELINGTKLKAPLEQQHRRTVLDALSEYQKNRMLAVKGVLRKGKNGNLKSIDSVEHVTILDPLDVETRLDELAALEDRWFNGKGVALDKTGLKALSEEFERNFDAELPLPHIYPTPEGGVLAEWTLDQWAVSLEIQIPSQTAQYQALNLASDEFSDLDLNLSESTGWALLNENLRNLNSSLSSG
jgi:hypothetical protein